MSYVAFQSQSAFSFQVSQRSPIKFKPPCKLHSPNPYALHRNLKSFNSYPFIFSIEPHRRRPGLRRGNEYSGELVLLVDE
ncbi:hypothetical protein L6164_025745 [Bauhinia variegata]|uniref:Uncharacterized protein n=1 Tax=Bauhinia variegata TaxID=167791 RepID=A0ACB9M1F9_BAUVA|nr:hypothetical protein L6164_025745 [Bauhinia variegata]